MKPFIFTLFVFFTTYTTAQDTLNVQNKIIKKSFHKNEITHNVDKLDNTLNIKNADIAPVYKGCENKESNFERINCLNTNLTIDVRKKFYASNSLKKIKRGLIKIRVVFIIDKNGYIKVKTILGNWPKNLKEIMKNSFESAPKLIPAKMSKQNIPVKYSIKIPFTIKT